MADEDDEHLGCGTGCEHHIRAERKARALTAEDKRRFEERYIAPRLATTIVTHHIPHACGEACSHGCIEEAAEGRERAAARSASTDDELDELEAEEDFLVMEQMRKARLAEMEREAQRAQAAPSSTSCEMVEFAVLRARLKQAGRAVICGLMASEHCAASQQTMSTLGHCAAEFQGITFIGCSTAQVSGGPTAEMGWDLVFVSSLPEVICFCDGAYVGHHGKLAASGGTGGGGSTLATEVDRWVRKMEVKVQARLPRNRHCGHRHCRVETDHTHSDDEHTTPARPRPAATTSTSRGANGGGGGDGSESDSDEDGGPKVRRAVGRAPRSTITRARHAMPSDDSDSD